MEFLNGNFAGAGYYPAFLAFLNTDSEARDYFLSLPEETQQELLNADGNFQDNLEALREKEEIAYKNPRLLRKAGIRFLPSERLTARFGYPGRKRISVLFHILQQFLYICGQ